MRISTLALATSILFFQSSGAASYDDVSLIGGVCSDDPFVIQQRAPQTADEHADFETIEFSSECKVLGVDRQTYHGLDQPPTSFICRQGGKSLLSGASYQKIRNSRIKLEGAVDTRVYVYKCVKGCTHAPKKIEYTISDCG